MNARGKKSCSDEGGTTEEGLGAYYPSKIVKFLVYEIPFPGFFAEHFQQINTQENAAASCLFYPSLVLLLVRFSVYGNKEASDAVRIMDNKRINKILTKHTNSAKNVPVIPI